MPTPQHWDSPAHHPQAEASSDTRIILWRHVQYLRVAAQPVRVQRVSLGVALSLPVRGLASSGRDGLGRSQIARGSR